VADIERSRRFYEQALGFRYDRELMVEGERLAKLARLTTPCKSRAVYLVREGFTLELIYRYYHPYAGPRHERVMNEPGLTHISLNVRDMKTACAKVKELGGQVLDDTDIGVAIFVRDPDGQLIELIQER
jgi:catechol 2,3-dioxygenase-like lactoylglutathione lyase family enzyme